METMQHVVMQEINEERYSRKHIDRKIQKAIQDNPETMARVEQGIELVTEFMAKPYYPAKQARIDALKALDVRTLVLDLFTGVAYFQRPELFTSVTAQLSARLGFSDRKEAIATVAELLAVLCLTDAFDIDKAGRSTSLMVQSRIELPQTLIDYIEHSEYLPPMVCEPLELTHNFSSGYLTHNDSLILGSGNHHDGDICIDVLNRMNKVPLRLDTEFLSQVEEEPSEITVEKVILEAAKKGKYLSAADAKERVRIALDNWDDFKRQSYAFYLLMQQCGNRFYMTHKVDKRGRIYSQGYHINPQGAPFKKAMIELANEELVTGVPNT